MRRNGKITILSHEDSSTNDNHSVYSGQRSIFLLSYLFLWSTQAVIFHTAQMLTPSLKGSQISRVESKHCYIILLQISKGDRINVLRIEGTEPGGVVNHSWGALFSKSLVGCNGFNLMWTMCVLAAGLTVSSQLSCSITLKLKHRCSANDTLVFAFYLVVMTVLPLLLHVFSSKEEKTLKVFISTLVSSSITWRRQTRICSK